MKNFIPTTKFKDGPFSHPHSQSIEESRIFLEGLGKSVVDFHRDPVCAEVVVDELKHGLAAVLVRLFKTSVFAEDLTDPSEELTPRETECVIVVEVVDDVFEFSNERDERGSSRLGRRRSTSNCLDRVHEVVHLFNEQTKLWMR